MVVTGLGVRATMARRLAASLLACATLPLTMAVAHAHPHHHGAPITCQVGSVSSVLAQCVTNGAALLAPPTPTYGLVPPIECDKHDGVISCYVPH